MNPIIEKEIPERMSTLRRNIYIGRDLRAVLSGRDLSLTDAITMLADRYMGMIERAPRNATTVRMDDVYRAVMKEKRDRPLSAREIAAFPAMVHDWMARHPG